MKKIIISGVLAGIAMAVVGFIVNFLFGLVFPNFQELYLNTDIFLSMTETRAFFFWIYPLVLGIALAWVYGIINPEYRSPFRFAWIYFLINGLPIFFINVGSFNLPVSMILSWTIMSYLNGLVAAFIFSKMLK